VRRFSRPARQPAKAIALAAVLSLVSLSVILPAKNGDTYPGYTSPSGRASILAGNNGDTYQGYMSPIEPAPADRALMLATTTSVDAAGLLDVLADAFKAETGITLKWIAVGTGAALKQARDGNADVVIAHARTLEAEFIRDGYGVNRRVFARNFFMVVGPPDDPARVAGSASAADAFGRIRSSGAPFASRGDRSGTHARELELWALVGGPPATSAYIETGQGMAETLRVAAERRAYTLTDTATFFALRSLSGLRPVFENAPELENIYAVMAVDPARVPTARYAEAMAFIAFLTSPRGQKLIGDHKSRTGRPLFEPLAGTPGVDLLK
jgi:tungstate transport system substrate-binding protein